MSLAERITHIQAPDAPPAIGPYSQAVVANGFVFCTGQVAINPATDHIIEGDIKVQARQVLENLRAVLRAAGSDLHHVVKTTVFLVHFDDFAAMNEVYGEYFSEIAPARSTVEVGALPRGLLVQIECIAVVPGSGGEISVIEARESESLYDLDADIEF
jgi:2-iminobutanoate/2-iminopropanoate deaminase